LNACGRHSSRGVRFAPGGTTRMSQPTEKKPLNPAFLASYRAKKAHAVDKSQYNFTPARRKALDEARKKRKFVMTPAKREAQRKATEANQRNWRLTPARLAAMKVNVRKMQRASVEKFQMTDRRKRASLANIAKAQAAERSPESYARSRFNHLQHGLDVRSLEETMHLMKEDPEEYEAHRQRFRRVFAPRFKAEERAVDLIAAATWRRLRLFHAQARWEADRLKHFFSRAEFVQPLDAEETRTRGLTLLVLLCERERLVRKDQSLIALVEREIRTLLRLRADGDPDFHLYSRDSRKTWRRYEKLRNELEAEYREIAELEQNMELMDRLREGGPEVDAAIEQARAARRSAS